MIVKVTALNGCSRGAAFPPAWLLVLLIVACPTLLWSAGIYRDGVGARAMSLGGAEVGQPDAPLEALHSNPAGLSLITAPTLQLGAGAGLAEGTFSQRNARDGHIENGLGYWPEFAVSLPVKSTGLTLGAGFFPDALLSGDWRYDDPPGGLGGVSYGRQKQFSELILLRGALGASYAISRTLSVGAGLGIVYNRNRLEAPYIFQSHPKLRGFKTLLDLEADGVGVNGNFGLVYRPHTNFSVGLSYHTETRVRTTGDASGNAGAQLQTLGGAFATVRPDFHYDAEVQNIFPQMASLGLSWRLHPRLRALAQVDWIDWSDSFDLLRINLTHGNNADLNQFLGTDSAPDRVPLNWNDRFVYRAGLEFSLTEQLTLRGGYCYGRSPVPDETLTPLTAAIMEHKLTAGFGWQHARYSVDLAYQYDFPASQSVGLSALAAGEYSHTRTEVSAHWFGLTTSVRF